MASEPIAGAPQASAKQAVKVWDLPVRLTHWSFAALVPAMWMTAENSQWGWHMRLGHVLLALLLFRIFWGLIGTDTARFANFVKGPLKVIQYLRGDYDRDRAIGHNPLGALAVVALLGVMLAQVSMGLFSGDPYDGATGPLNALVGVGTADMLTDWHETFFYIVGGLVLLHITAIAIYAGVRLENLVGPMVTGSREVAAGVEGTGDVPWGRALGAFALAAAIAFWVYSGAPPLT